MKSSILSCLVVLNAVLLFLLVGGRISTARADYRRPGDYLLIPSVPVPGSAEVVYVLDVSSGKLGAIGYDDMHQKIEGMPTINLNTVFGSASDESK